MIGRIGLISRISLIGLISIIGLIGLRSFASASSMTHLTISQVQVEGDGGSNDEFIELYNPTSSSVSLNGWSLQYKSSSGNFPLTSGKKNLPNVSIPAGGYFLIAHSSYNGTVGADHVHSSFSLSGASNGATIFLVNSTSFLSSGTDSAIVDTLGYGSSANNSPETANASVPASEQALLRSTDTDNNGSDFTVTSSNPHNSLSLPTPSPAPTSNQPSPVSYSIAIKISEFMPNPEGNDSGEEWVELYNDSNSHVELKGWKLDDYSSDGKVGSSALLLSEYTIVPSGYLVVALGEEAFSLNNSSDTVRLIWPDGKIADQISYESAKEEQTYAKKPDGSFAWTSFVTKGMKNKFEDSVQLPLASSDDHNIKINEIFPNPAGPDSGKEWVELTNLGLGSVDLHNWILDDGEVRTEIGSSAYQIQSPTVAPNGLVVITISSGKFALNNTGKETLRLFNPSKVLIDSVTYEGASEGLSYSKNQSGKWDWIAPTPAAANILTPKSESIVTQIVINELFPQPDKGVEEFIELVNLGKQEVSLTGFSLSDNVSSYRLSEISLKAGEFAVIKKSESKISLNNSGEEKVQLVSASGKIISEVVYEDAPSGQSFNRTANGDYVWSVTVTPGEENQVKVLESGIVAGQQLPRTGKGGTMDWQGLSFALFVILWYVYKRTCISKS